MRIGRWVNLVSGVLIILIAVEGGPYAFGSKWVAVSVLVVAGALNIVIGVCVLLKTRKRKHRMN